MKYIILIIFMHAFVSSNVIYDFNQKSNPKDWYVVNDGVMGGLSSGSFEISPEGHGLFKGHVSLANNGGFTSVRHRFDRKSVQDFTKVVLKVKGDSKNYQFRIKSKSSDYYSYITTFKTSGNWQEIEIPLNSFYPSFRGRKLDMPNFSEDGIEEIAFLIANKREERFQLLIDKIELK